ncbi:MAG: DUF748 domain-containing protein [Candidatus Omnitrophica bacterium]|nr:DUF748 domain-containing protein [Candidatus Omnitrophota bacterium]
MEKFIKILIALLVVTGIIIAVFAGIVTVKGKDIITAQLEKNLKTDVKIDKVSFAIPLSVKIEGLEIGDFFKAGQIIFSPNLAGVFAGRIILNGVNIMRPEINLKTDEKGKLILPVLSGSGKPPAIIITGLNITDGEIIFTDGKISQRGYKTVLDKVNLKVSGSITLPASLRVKADFNAEVCDGDKKALGGMNFSGWVDLKAKDMDGVFKISGLEVTHFAPYYGDFISHRKLVSAKLNLVSILKAKNNDLNVDSMMKLYNLVYLKEETTEGQPQQFDLEKKALDLFADKEGNIIFEFVFDTKLDDPQITSDKLKQIMQQAAIKNLASQSPAALMDKIGNTVKDFEDFGKKMKELFKKKQ